MKKFRWIALLFAALFLFSACDDVKEEDIIKAEKAELINGDLVITYADGYTYSLGALQDISMIYQINPENGVCFAKAALSNPIPNLFRMEFGDKVKQAGITDRGISIDYVMIDGKPYGSFYTHVQSVLRDNITELTVAATNDGATVTMIENGAFWNLTALTKVTLPKTITVIGSSAFYNCTALTDIYFDGTVAEWNAIEKKNDWNDNASDFIIHCSDGDIA